MPEDEAWLIPADALAAAPAELLAAADLDAALFDRGPRARLGRTVATLFAFIC